jgi:hypothetical protein
VIVAFAEYVTLHVVPEVDVHPVHPLKLLLPALAGATKFSDVPELSATVNGVVPVASTLFKGLPYPICTPSAGFVLATDTV